MCKALQDTTSAAPSKTSCAGETQDVFEGAAGDAFLAAIDEDTSLVLAAYPDFYGTVVDLTPVADAGFFPSLFSSPNASS